MTLFLVCKSNSIRVLRQIRFSCRFLPLSFRRYEVNQGLEVHGLIVTIFRGAYLSSIKGMSKIEVVNK